MRTLNATSETKPSTRQVQIGSSLIMVVVFVTLLLIGFSQSILALQNMQRKGFAATPNLLKTQFNESLPWRKAFIQTSSAARYSTVRASEDQVRIGRDGWLYITQELRTQPDQTANWKARVDAVIALERGFKQRGIQLVVAVVPAKARVHPEHLPNGVRFDQQQNTYSEFMDSLEHAGVTVSRLDKPMLAAKSNDLFYRTDTHWNRAGAKLAAQELARTIRSLKLELPRTEYRTKTIGPEQSRPGDLLNLMGLSDVNDAWRPPADHEAPLETKSIAVANQGLLGAPISQVVLVGSSYSLRGNFKGFLQEALSSSVTNAAREGSGFAGSMIDFLNNPSWKNQPPKIVVWEFAERFLSLPLETTPLQNTPPHWK
jgi:alginate O-acetyltransferase complex protein AlgJ